MKEGALEPGKSQSTFQMLRGKEREKREPACWEGVLTAAGTATFPTKHPKSRADLLLLPWLGTPKGVQRLAYSPDQFQPGKPRSGQGKAMVSQRACPLLVSCTPWDLSVPPSTNHEQMGAPPGAGGSSSHCLRGLGCLQERGAGVYLGRRDLAEVQT